MRTQHPRYWSLGIVPPMGHAEDYHAQSVVLRDRYDRGVRLWESLDALDWYWPGDWREIWSLRDRTQGLRREYRSLLKTLVDAHQRQKVNPVHVVDVPHPAGPAKWVRPNLHGKQEVVPVEHYRSYLAQPPVVVPMSDDDRKRQVEGAFYGTYDAFRNVDPPSSASSTPSTHADSSSYSGHGGHYGGAGVSGGWDSGSSSTSCDTSSSTDTGGGGDCGGGSID